MSLMAMVASKILRNGNGIMAVGHGLDCITSDFEDDGITKEILSELIREIEECEKNIDEIKEWISKANQLIDLKGNTQVSSVELKRAFRRRKGI